MFKRIRIFLYVWIKIIYVGGNTLKWNKNFQDKKRLLIEVFNLQLYLLASFISMDPPGIINLEICRHLNLKEF